MQQSHRGRDENPVASGFQEIQALLVCIFAVIEDVDPMLESGLDRGGRAHMCRNTLAVRVCSLRRYGDLLVAHDGLLRTGARYRLISRDVQLERVHPFAYQASARAHHLVRTVHHQRDGLAVDVHAAFIAEIAGVGQLGAGSQQSRPRCVPRVDLVPEHHVEAWLGGAPAHARRKPRFEHDLGVTPALEHVLLGGHVTRFGDIGLVQKRQVRVSVDHAGDDRMP